MSLVGRLLRDEVGQDTVEYGAVLAFVAVAAVLGLALAGNGYLTLWNKLAVYLAPFVTKVP